VAWDLEKICLTLMIKNRAKMGQKMKSRFLDPISGFLTELAIPGVRKAVMHVFRH
jgi:hypothetical protein